MTQPDGYTPVGAANYDSFAGFAATTQGEWETQMQADLGMHFLGFLNGLCSAVVENPIAQWLIAQGQGDSVVAQLLNGLQDFADQLCALVTCGVIQPGSTTPGTVLGAVSDIINALLESPFVQGLLDFSSALGDLTGNIIVDLLNAAIYFADTILNILTCGTVLPGSFQNMLDSLADIMGLFSGHPLIAGLVELVEGTGRTFFDTISGAFAFVEQLVSLLTCGLIDASSTAPVAIIGVISGILTKWGLADAKLMWQTYVAALLAINWSNPLQAAHAAWMATVDWVQNLWSWAMGVFQRFVGSAFPTLIGTDGITGAWAAFTTALGGLNWSSVTADWSVLDAVVTLVCSAVEAAFSALQTMTGFDLSGLWDAGGLTPLWGTVSEYVDAMLAVDWGQPLQALHTAWMATVDLGQGIAAWWGGVFSSLLGIGYPSFFELDLFKAAWAAFTAAVGGLNWLTLGAYWTAIDAMITLWCSVTEASIAVLRNLSGIDLSGLWDAWNLAGLWSCFHICGDTLLAIQWLQPGALMDAIGAVIGLFKCVGNWVRTTLHDLIGWDVDLIHDMFSSVTNFVAALVEFFTGALGLEKWLNVLHLITGIAGPTLSQAVSAIIDFFTAIGGPLPELLDRLLTLFGGGIGGTLADLIDTVEGWLPEIPTIAQIVQAILGAFGLSGDGETLEDLIAALAAWVDNIPLVGPFVSAITNGAHDTLSGLAQWAQNLLHGDSAIPGQNIVGEISAALLGLLPVGHISGDQPNLLSDGGFSAASVISAGAGWSYDGTENHSGSGGSAKVVCDGTVRQLFSNMIPVSGPDGTGRNGQTLDLAVWIKWSSLVSTGSPISVGVRTYDSAGGQLSSYVNVAAKSSPGSSGGWVLISNNWPVTAGVAFIRMVIQVSGASSGTVWFDDADIHKAGLLDQGLVAQLFDVWNGIVGGNYGGVPSTGIKTPTDLWWAAYTGAANTTAAGNNATAAQGTATTAAGKVQSTVDTVVTALGGSGTNHPVEHLTTQFQDLWNKLFRTTTPQSTIHINAVPTAQLGKSNITDLQSTVDTVVTGLTGTQSSGAQISAINTNFQGLYTKLFNSAQPQNKIHINAVPTAQLGKSNITDLQATIDKVVGGLTGTTVSGSDHALIATHFASAWQNLFKANAPQSTIHVDAVPTVPATKVGSGIFHINRIPTSQLSSANIADLGTVYGGLSGVGSGARMVRHSTSNVDLPYCDGSYNLMRPGYFDWSPSTYSTTDIGVDMYNNKFTVTLAGWYRLDICYRFNQQLSASWNIATQLWKQVGTNTPAAYAIGQDAIAFQVLTVGVTPRIVQSSFQVQLAAGDSVVAGYVGNGGGVGHTIGNVLTGEPTGVEAYFTIAMLNKQTAIS